MKIKSILFLAGGRFDSYKAYTQNFLSFARIAKGKGYTVTLSGLTKSSTFFLNELADKKIIVRKNKIGILKLLVKNLSELFYRHNDVVVLGSLYTWMFPFYSLALKINRPKRIVYYMQDPVPEAYALMKKKNNSPIKIKIFYLLAIICEKIICRVSNIIILPGRGYLEIVNKRNKFNDKLILFSYNTWGIWGILEENFHTEFKNRVIDKFEINKKFPIILYSGKIQRGIRGLEMQLRVLKKLVRSYPKALIIITGTGDSDWINGLAQDYQISKNVLLTGEITNKELKVIYTISDIMIFPPLSYLLPTKFFEAISTSVIPIVWDGSKDMVKILEKGVFTYDGSEKNLLKTIDKTTNNIDRYKKEIAHLPSKVIELHKTSEKSLSIALNMERDCC